MAISPETSPPTERGRQFFGTITASLSHEINNVLATVNELAGLLEDLCKAAEHGAAPNVARLRGVAERISAQVERGRRLVKRLNRFAHTVDGDQSTIETKGRLEEIAALCQRFAALRRVSLEVDLPQSSPVLRGSPFDLQHMTYRCVDAALSISDQGDTVTLSLREQNGGAIITVRCSQAASESVELEDRLSFLSRLVRALAGKLEVRQEPSDLFELEVSLPPTLRPPRNSQSREEE
jgi:signal transduction histidine kinase